MMSQYHNMMAHAPVTETQKDDWGVESRSKGKTESLLHMENQEVSKINLF
jgi:hypothetical protein